METIAAGHQGLARVLDIARHMVLPVTTLALCFVALYTRVMRASMLEVLNQDYVTTARAKGLSEQRITYGHVLRNALLPVVTLVGVQIGTILGGSVLVETVFSWPGLGRLAFEAVFQRDINLLLGILLLCPQFVFAIVVVAILSPSVLNVIVAIALVSWPAVARLVRGEFLALREREFVQASVAIGRGDLRIIVTQILPNALGPIIVTGSLMVATAILTEGGLAFLGLGDPNIMSWVTIIGGGRDALRSA